MERTIATLRAPAPWAMRVEDTRGRRFPEPTHAYRSDYARDRDRIIHSRAFRRLEAKTQVFTTRYSDHFRNRLTHTLEVAQIARTVAAALGLNTELAEALALVHDIGHPPFGHAGESKLDELMRAHGGRFNHNLHALRIVEHFEQRYLDFPGLRSKHSSSIGWTKLRTTRLTWTMPWKPDFSISASCPEKFAFLAGLTWPWTRRIREHGRN